MMLHGTQVVRQTVHGHETAFDLFASYPGQRRAAPNLLIASICKQVLRPLHACPCCHAVDRTCSVLFTTPTQRRKTNCTQRLIFIARKAYVANSLCPSLTKLMQQDRSDRHWFPTGSEDNPMTNSNSNMSMVSTATVHQDRMVFMRFPANARSTMCFVTPPNQIEYVTKCQHVSHVSAKMTSKRCKAKH